MPYKYNNKNKYTYKNLYDDFIIEFRNDEEVKNQKLSKSDFTKILVDLDTMMFEEAIYHGTAITYPNLCIINVLLEKDTSKASVFDRENSLLTTKRLTKIVPRINTGATRANKKRLEQLGQFDVDPTIYFDRNFFARIKFIKIYGKDYVSHSVINKKHSKGISIFKATPSNKFRKILAAHLNDITLEIADNKYKDMLQNKNIIQKNFII